MIPMTTRSSTSVNPVERRCLSTTIYLFGGEVPFLVNLQYENVYEKSKNP
jgi:hypothetical protein